MNDDARARGEYRARRAWERDTWKAGRDKEKANKVAPKVKRAAALTAERAAQSEEKTAAVCDRPPGLGEVTGHIEAPNMGAGGSHSQATTTPDPWARSRRPFEGQTMVKSLPEAVTRVDSSRRPFEDVQSRSRQSWDKISSRRSKNASSTSRVMYCFQRSNQLASASVCWQSQQEYFCHVIAVKFDDSPGLHSQLRCIFHGFVTLHGKWGLICMRNVAGQLRWNSAGRIGSARHMQATSGVLSFRSWRMKLCALSMTVKQHTETVLKSNSKHVEHMARLWRLKLGLKGTPTLVPKATGRRRDIDER